MPYATQLVVNNILERSFRDECFITPSRLQRIMYIAASEYHKASEGSLISEVFEPWESGPILRSIRQHFLPLGGSPITRYIRDADGNTLECDERADPHLQRALDTAWAATAHRDHITLSQITRTEGSAWWKAVQDGQVFMSDDDILEDTTYYTPLGIMPAGATTND